VTNRSLRALVITAAIAACAPRADAQEQTGGPTMVRDGLTISSITPAPDAPELSPGPGRVPVTFSSAQPLTIDSNDGAYNAVNNWGRTFAVNQERTLCTTPCTLNLRPGKFNFVVRGDHIRSYGDLLKVPPTGADVRLRPLSRGFTAAGALMWIGIPLNVAGAIGLLVWGVTSNVHHDWGDHTKLGVGAGLLAAGQLLMTIGVPLAYATSSGIASVHPHPTAQLTIGAGSLGVRGTF